MAATTLAADPAPPELGSLRSRNGEIEGLRAVAALMVLVTHVSLNAMGNRGPFGGLLARLDVGVAVFFVLSGYLLYRPFAAALLSASPLPSIRRYFRHRLLRIVPLYWLVVLVSFLFPTDAGRTLPTSNFGSVGGGFTHVPFADLVRSLTFTQVYWKNSLAGPMPQAWTLATEMAFYLFLPVLALVLHRLRGADRAQRLRRQWWMLGLLAVSAQLYRLAMVLIAAPFRPGADTRRSFTQAGAWLPNHLDLFAVGMAFAVIVVERESRGPGAGIAARLDGLFRRRGAAGLSVLVAVGLLTLAGYGLGLSRSDLSYGRVGEFARHLSYLGVGVALILPAIFGRAGGGGYRAFLRSAPMQYLGKVSYGIYLWQIFTIGRWVSSPFAPGGTPDPARHPGQQFNAPFWPMLVWTVLVTVALASASWYLVERPFLRYKDRPMGLFVSGVWVVSLASLATRLWAIGTVTARNPGNGDPFYYHAQANMLADGVGFGEPIQWLTQGRFVPTAIHPPLFSLWLLPASLIGSRGFLSHKTMAVLAGVALVVVTAILVRRLAGDRAGVIAAVLVALYPNLFIIDGTLWSEALYTAVVALAVLFAYRWRDHPTAGRALWLGAAVGTAVLARGEALLLLPLLCLPLAISARKLTPMWWRHGLLMGVAAVSIVAPWTVRNLLTFNKPVLVSTNSEEVLFYANCPETYSGPLIGFWSFNCQEQVRHQRVAAGLPADPPGDESERAAGWGALGRTYAEEHKSRWPAVVEARVARVWDLQHSDTTARALQFEGRPYAWSIRGLWAYRLLVIPGLVGLWLLRRRGEIVWPLLTLFALVTLTAVGVYGHVRFRTVGDLVLVIGTAVALDLVLPGRSSAAVGVEQEHPTDQGARHE